MTDYDWPDFPVILGQGACHTLREGPRLTKKGKPAKQPKARPIGFHIPRKAK